MKALFLVVFLTGCAAPKKQRFSMVESSLPVAAHTDPIRTPEYLKQFYHGAIAEGDYMMAPGSVYRVERRAGWNRNAFNGNPEASVRTNLPQAVLSEPTVETNHKLLKQLSEFSSQLGYVIQLQTNAQGQSKVTEERLQKVEERIQRLEKK